jgi:Ran GTPase-activating protein (RanGAP) involved in mRNA processing and transport
MSTVLLLGSQYSDAMKKMSSSGSAMSKGMAMAGKSSGKSSGASSSSSSSSSSSAKSSSEASTGEEEDNYYPFEKASGELTVDQVAGMRIKGKKVILLGYGNTYSVQSLPEEGENFSDMNFFRKYPKLMSIELSGMEVTPEMLENLQKFAPQDLKSIILRNCSIAKDEYYDLIVDFIEKHSQLESITLILPDLDGDPCDKILEAIKENKQLKFLNLVVAGFSPKGSACLEEILTNSAEHMEGISFGIGKIREKDKSKVEECYEKIAEALAKLKNLKTLDLAFMSLSEDAFGHIANSLEGFLQLRTLRLFFGSLDEHNHIKLFEHAEILQKSLESLKNLEVLDISSNALPHEAMQLILMAPSQLKKLKTLNISGNVLGEDSAAILASSLGEHLSVTTLIANNCSINDAAMGALFAKPENIPPLQYLYLKENEIKEGINKVPVSKINDISVIDFSGNQISYDEVIAFVDEVAEHSNLILNFKNNAGIDGTDDIEKSRRRDELEQKRIEKKAKAAFFGV